MFIQVWPKSVVSQADLDKEMRFPPRGLLRGLLSLSAEDRALRTLQENTIRGPLTTAVRRSRYCNLSLDELLRCTRDVWEDECATIP